MNNILIAKRGEGKTTQILKKAELYNINKQSVAIIMANKKSITYAKQLLKEKELQIDENLTDFYTFNSALTQKGRKYDIILIDEAMLILTDILSNVFPGAKIGYTTITIND